MVVEEPEQVTRRVGQRRLPPGGPHARDDRNGVVGDEVAAEPLPLQELAIGRQVLLTGRAQEGQCAPVEPLDLPQHPEKPGVDEAARLGEDAPQPAAAGILQPAPLAADAHAHLGGTHLDVQLAEEPAQPGVGHVVVDDEPAVDSVPAAIGVGEVVGVRVAAEPALRLEKGDVVGAGQQVGRGEPGDPGADDGNGRPPCVRGSAVLLGSGAGGGRRAVGGGAHDVQLPSRVCLGMTLAFAASLVKCLSKYCRVSVWTLPTARRCCASVS